MGVRWCPAARRRAARWESETSEPASESGPQRRRRAARPIRKNLRAGAAIRRSLIRAGVCIFEFVGCDANETAESGVDRRRDEVSAAAAAAAAARAAGRPGACRRRVRLPSALCVCPPRLYADGGKFSWGACPAAGGRSHAAAGRPRAPARRRTAVEGDATASVFGGQQKRVGFSHLTRVGESGTLSHAEKATPG